MTQTLTQPLSENWREWPQPARARYLERLKQLNPDTDLNPYRRYQFNPAAYIHDHLGWTPWNGTEDEPGQQQILDAYTLALLQQHERLAWERGEKTEEELIHWQPGQIIQTWIRVESGNGIGKTKIGSGIVSHFYDCFPSITYTFAPTTRQIRDLLWKEIKSDRGKANLPGRVLETCELKSGDPLHFAIGRAAGAGERVESIQGQHGPYLLFLLDEAEGVQEYVYDAISSMAAGGIFIVLLFANPRTRSSRFHKIRGVSNVCSFRVSCLSHPNVKAGREIISGAVRREFVQEMIEKHCEVVEAHDEDSHTFTVPFEVRTAESVYPPGTVFQPDAEMLYRVLGEAPANLADNTFVPIGRYEAACKRTPTGQNPERARIGVDVAGYGLDVGTIYLSHKGVVTREGTHSQGEENQDPTEYWQKVRKVAPPLKAQGVTSLHIRIDAGGGYGNGLASLLKRDQELIDAFPDYKVILVHNNGKPHDGNAYKDMVTEMYAETGESLKGLAIRTPPERLEADLTERMYRFVNVEGKWVKKLEDKESFRKRQTPQRSPDDGDGFVLCVAPDFLFARERILRFN